MTLAWILGISVLKNMFILFRQSVNLEMLEADYVCKKWRSENRDSVQSEEGITPTLIGESQQTESHKLAKVQYV